MPLTMPVTALLLPLSTALAVSAPVPPVIPLRVTAPFDAPAQPWGAGHRGIDVAADTDQPVASLTAGHIGFSGRVAGKPVVTVLLVDGRRVTYEPVVSELEPGAPVRAGQLIGTVAPSGGHCGGIARCLHIGLRAGDTYLDPMMLLRRPAVLKPVTGTR